VKKLLFAFLILGLVVPAVGDVLVYVESYKETEIVINPNTGQGDIDKPSGRAYRILEQVDNDTIANQTIELWKDKDDNGKMQNYYEVDPQWTADFITADIGKKLMWVISYEDGTVRLLLTGEAKLNKTIGSTIAVKLDGYAIWDEIDDDEGIRDVGYGKLSFKLDAKLTLKVKGLSSEQAVDAIVNDLKASGYLESD